MAANMNETNGKARVDHKIGHCRSVHAPELGWRGILIAGLMAPVFLAGCADFPTRLSHTDHTAPAQPPLRFVGGEASAQIDILTYNIEGLQWPARTGRADHLQKIGKILKTLNDSGHAPDVVLFQEVFSRAAVRAVFNSGYPDVVGGPKRIQPAIDKVAAIRPGKRRPTKGELGIRFTGSGLVIASRYPVIATVSDAYSRRTCAGLDCLANKGVVMARIQIPGVPVPIDIANTHMNAQKASKVRPERHLAAHRSQAQELDLFLKRHHNLASPLVLGGDFNMRNSPDRFDFFRAQVPLRLVHEQCPSDPRCDVHMSWDGDAPWMDTQDLQLYASGQKMEILPIRVEAMFDGSRESPRLSDHDGFRVVYQIIWKLPSEK